MTDSRTEHDSLGDVEVPSDALWGAQTQRAVNNFPISGVPVSHALIVAIAEVKVACARINGRLGVVPAEVAGAIATAAIDIANGAHADQFPIDWFQTGSGTSSNMNVNEVIAHVASERLGSPVRPNDDVNASQSSNDVFPTAIHLASARAINEELVPALTSLAATLSRRGIELADVVKPGRTHLMDAVPVTLGQEFAGYAAQIERSLERLDAALPRVREVPLGGTAVGTGLNTPSGWRSAVVAELALVSGVPVTAARDGFEAQGSRDALVELSGVLRTLAVSLTKICNDLRWMNSGPNTGLAEISLPELQPGSSIMPGKVNPVVPEAVLQVCAQVMGNDAAITWAGAAGNFELNVMLPVIARNLLESIHLLATSTALLATSTIADFTVNADALRERALASPAIVTALNKVLGYERAAKVVQQAKADGVDVSTALNALVDKGELTADQLAEATNLLALARPHGA